jgi:hypothetical protein
MNLPGPNAGSREAFGYHPQKQGTLALLISDLLDLASIESGKVELKPEWVVGQLVVNEAIDAPAADGVTRESEGGSRLSFYAL